MLGYIIVIAIFITILLTISSRIRKAASRAFEREEIAGREFFLIKPEGLINPINNKSKFAFEAYSKDFGKGDAEDLKQAQIFVNVFPDADFTEICEDTKRAAGEILSEELAENEKICLIKNEETLENTTAYNFYKIIESDTSKKIYVLKFSVLKGCLEDYQDRIDETLESFKLK
jgi:hypothetical protein